MTRYIAWISTRLDYQLDLKWTDNDCGLMDRVMGQPIGGNRLMDHSVDQPTINMVDQPATDIEVMDYNVDHKLQI